MRMRALDGWRGIGALAVCFIHLQLSGYLTAAPSLDSWTLAVDFFFVLSGFVMARDRVSAGYAMIEAVAPFEVQKMRWGGRFYDSSAGKISACLEAAKKTGKDQRCSITVPAPAQ